MRQIEQKFFDEILDNMFKAVGFDKFNEEFTKQEEWYKKKTWATKQQDNFRQCFIAKARKDLKWSKKTAEREYGWFNLNYGWKIKD